MIQKSKKIFKRLWDNIEKFVSLFAILSFFGFGFGMKHLNEKIINLEDSVNQISNQNVSVTVAPDRQSERETSIVSEAVVETETMLDQGDIQESSKWTYNRREFDLDDDEYYCVRKKKNHNFQYYFISYSEGFAINDLMKLKLKVSDKVVSGNNSIVIAYSEGDEKSYRLFFPDVDKNFIRFDVDHVKRGNLGGENDPLTNPFYVFYDEFAIDFDIAPIQDNRVNFRYTLTHIDPDLDKSFPEKGNFESTISVNPNLEKKGSFKIGVHNNGPCFKVVESEKGGKDNKDSEA